MYTVKHLDPCNLIADLWDIAQNTTCMSATVPLCTNVACGCPAAVYSYRKHFTGSPLEKWQSHCSEKVNEIDFSRGVPKSRN